MPPFADQLARLRVAAATGRIPRDLATWALDELTARADHAERLDMRDRLLVEAAALLPGETAWARAKSLANEIAALDRRRGRLDAVRELIAAALDLDPDMPRSHRHIYRLLTDTRGGCAVSEQIISR